LFKKGKDYLPDYSFVLFGNFFILGNNRVSYCLVNTNAGSAYRLQIALILDVLFYIKIKHRLFCFLKLLIHNLYKKADGMRTR